MRSINARLKEHMRGETERVLRRTQGAGCAAGGIPSGKGWEVSVCCFCVITGLDWYGQGTDLSL